MADTIDIARLRALVAAAAKPPYFMKAADPWTSADGRHVQFGRYDISTGSHDVEAENYYRVASVSNINNSPVNLANALLFNEAPTAILSLCDEVDRLRSALSAAMETIEVQDRQAPLVAEFRAGITAENDRLRSELEVVKADAARYRALRDDGEWIAFDTVWLHEHDLYGQGPAEMDAAIDAAMNDRKETQP